MPKPFNANSWEFSKRIIRIGHNRKVKQYFKDTPSDSATSTGRKTIKTSLLIRANDSALECLCKMMYFFGYLWLDPVTTYPSDWAIKKGQDIPQLAIVYREIPKVVAGGKKPARTGNYTTYIPHYNGNKTPKIMPYEKGDYWARWVLKDNSQILVYAETEEKALLVIKQLEKYVEIKYQTPEKPWLTTGKLTKGTHKKVKVQPLRADFYPDGKENGFPKWRYYF